MDFHVWCVTLSNKQRSQDGSVSFVQHQTQAIKGIMALHVVFIVFSQKTFDELKNAGVDIRMIPDASIGVHMETVGSFFLLLIA